MPEEDKVLIVNLKTGETKEVDEAGLWLEGMPKGFVIALEVTIEEWVIALRNAFKRC